MKILVMLILVGSVSFGQVIEPWNWANPLPQGNHLNTLVVRQSGEIIAGGEGGMLLRSTTAGNTWTGTPYPGGLRVIYASSFPTDDIGFLTGDDRFGAGTVIKTTDGGGSWQPLQTSTFAALTDIHFLDANTGHACGTRGTVIRTTDGGTTWDQLPTNRQENVLSVDFRSPLIGTAALEGGSILDTYDGGSTWTMRTISPTRSVRSVRFKSNGEGLAVGDSGLVMTRSIDGGPWTLLQPVTTASMRILHVVNASVAIAAGMDGGLIYTHNGGVTWDSAFVDLQTDIACVGGIDTTNLWLVGPYGSMATSTDAGRSWSVRSSGIRTDLQALSTLPTGAAMAAGTGPEVFRKNGPHEPWLRLQHDLPSNPQTLIMVSDSVALAAGTAGALHRTTDGGSTWTPLSGAGTATLYAGTRRSGVLILVGSGGVILRSTDEGMSWTPVTSTVTSRIRAVGFASDSLVIAAGDNGIILRSADAGLSWSSSTGPVITRLQSVCFGDPLHGVIGGAPLGAALPPTLLATSDGGITWVSRQVTVPYSTDPFVFFIINTIASRRPGHYIAGTVEGIFFRSTDHGQSWGQVLTGTNREVRSIVWSYDRWLAVGAAGMIIESDRDSTVVGVEALQDEMHPGMYLMLDAYPNPFNPATTIAVSSSRSGHGRAEVYTLQGKKAGTIFDGDMLAGHSYRIPFDASHLSSGTYIVRLTQGHLHRSRAIMLVK